MSSPQSAKNSWGSEFAKLQKASESSPEEGAAVLKELSSRGGFAKVASFLLKVDKEPGITLQDKVEHKFGPNHHLTRTLKFNA